MGDAAVVSGLMAGERVLLLDHHHLGIGERGAEQPGGRQAEDAAADDDDPHQRAGAPANAAGIRSRARMRSSIGQTMPGLPEPRVRARPIVRPRTGLKPPNHIAARRRLDLSDSNTRRALDRSRRAARILIDGVEDRRGRSHRRRARGLRRILAEQAAAQARRGALGPDRRSRAGVSLARGSAAAAGADDASGRRAPVTP